MDIEVVAVPFNGKSVKVIETCWRDDADTVITVWLKETGERASVTFNKVQGIRMLDELDVASFWLSAPKSKLSVSWLFKVNQDGWFDFEATREDFYSKHSAQTIEEYLIAGYQECVSVLCSSAPRVQQLKSQFP